MSDLVYRTMCNDGSQRMTETLWIIGVGRGGLGGWSPPNIFLEGAEPPQYFRPDSIMLTYYYKLLPKVLKGFALSAPPIFMPLIRQRG